MKKVGSVTGNQHVLHNHIMCTEMKERQQRKEIRSRNHA